jgi:hypothetical protein
MLTASKSASFSDRVFSVRFSSIWFKRRTLEMPQPKKPRQRTKKLQNLDSFAVESKRLTIFKCRNPSQGFGIFLPGSLGGVFFVLLTADDFKTAGDKNAILILAAHRA